jgi:hypothetical protein
LSLNFGGISNVRLTIILTACGVLLTLLIFLFGDAIVFRSAKSKKEPYRDNIVISDETEKQETGMLPSQPPTKGTPKGENSYIPSVNIRSLKFSYSSRLCDFDIVCPQISGLADKALQSRMNEYILEKAGVRLGNLERECKGYEKEVKERKSEKEFPFEWKGNYKVRFNRDGILSLTVDNYKGAWGGHGGPHMDSCNFDLNEGTMIEFNNLFAFQHKEKIYDLLKKQAKDAGYDNSGAQDFQGVYLTENDIVVFYDPYRISGGAAGVVEIPMPIRSVKKYLNPKSGFAKIIP